MHMNFQGFHNNLLGFKDSDMTVYVLSGKTGEQFPEAEVRDSSPPINSSERLHSCKLAINLHRMTK